jgi:hypothetical protein
MISRRRDGARLVRHASGGQKIEGLLIVARAMATAALAIAGLVMVNEVLKIAVHETVIVDPATAIAVLATGVAPKIVGRARVDRQTVARRPDVDLVVDLAELAVSVVRCPDLHLLLVRWPLDRQPNIDPARSTNGSLAWNTSSTRC